MSTPSSIVGEQKRTGRNAVRLPELPQPLLVAGELLALLVTEPEPLLADLALLSLHLRGVLPGLEPEQGVAGEAQEARRGLRRGRGRRCWTRTPSYALLLRASAL